LILDYRQQEDGFTNPTRYLVDELVEIEPQSILGRAYVRIGGAQMPVAFFALQKASIERECDGSDQRDLS